MTSTLLHTQPRITTESMKLIQSSGSRYNPALSLGWTEIAYVTRLSDSSHCLGNSPDPHSPLRVIKNATITVNHNHTIYRIKSSQFPNRIQNIRGSSRTRV